MWLSIAKFFASLLKLVLAAVTGIINWVREKPREAFILLVGLMLSTTVGVGTYKWTMAKEAKTISALRGEVKKANDETKARDEKIKKIEEDSKKNADSIKSELDASKARAAQVVADYAQKLKDEKKNYKVIYVKDKDGKDVPVTIDQKGEVMCERFSDTFFDAVNKLIDEANAPVLLKPSATITK